MGRGGKSCGTRLTHFLPAGSRTPEFIGEWTVQSLTNLLPIGRFHCNHQMERDSKIERRQRGARQSSRATDRSTGKQATVDTDLYFAVSVTVYVRHYALYLPTY